MSKLVTKTNMSEYKTALENQFNSKIQEMDAHFKKSVIISNSVES